MDIHTRAWEARFAAERDSMCFEHVLRWATWMRGALEPIVTVASASSIVLLVANTGYAAWVAIASAAASALLTTLLSQARIDRLRDAYTDISAYEMTCRNVWEKVDSDPEQKTEKRLDKLNEEAVVLRKKHGGLIPEWLLSRMHDKTAMLLAERGTAAT